MGENRRKDKNMIKELEKIMAHCLARFTQNLKMEKEIAENRE